jgi:hypothetical protein
MLNATVTPAVTPDFARQTGGLKNRVIQLEEEISGLRASLTDGIVTRSVRVLDGSGRERCRIADGWIVLTGANGIERIAMGCEDDFTSLTLLTTEDDTCLTMAAGEESGTAEASLTASTKAGAEVSVGCDSGRLAPGVAPEDISGPLPTAGPSTWIRNGRPVSTSTREEQVQ